MKLLPHVSRANHAADNEFMAYIVILGYESCNPGAVGK